MNIIEKLHAQWAQRAVPPGASPDQRQDMKMAFYSGFIACLSHQLTEVATIEDDAAAAAALQTLHDEAEAYFRDYLNEPPDYFRRQ